MPGATGHSHGFHHDALVHAHRHQRGRLADYGGPGLRVARGHQGAGAVHGTLLVGGRQQDQRLLQGGVQEGSGGGQGQREEALHIRAAQAVQPVVALGEGQGVTLPAALVEGHGVGVACQHQAAGPAPQGRDQVGFGAVCGNRLDLGAKPHIAQPAGQQVDDRAVALVPQRVGGADGRCRHQLSQLFDDQSVNIGHGGIQGVAGRQRSWRTLV